jgi:hypothetical protein
MKHGERLKEHWQMEHAAELAKIKQWLGESDAKIATFAALAAEGMKGTGQDDSSVIGQRYDRGGRAAE